MLTSLQLRWHHLEASGVHLRSLALVVASAVLLPAAAGAAPATEAPRPAAVRTKVAVLELRAIGVDAKVAELLSEVALTEAASLPGLAVIGRSDIEAILGLENQRRILGCAEDSACLAEIGGALGVRLVFAGSVGKLGALHRLDLKVIEAGRADSARRKGVNVEGAEEELVAAVQAAVRELFAPEVSAAGAVTPAGATAARVPAVPPPAVARPAAPPPAAPARPWLLGLRIGYAAAGGKFEEGVNQADYVGGQAALQLEALYRSWRGLSLGGYVGYGFADPGDRWSSRCDETLLQCSTSVVRLGLDAVYELGGPAATFVPWAGAGLGVEFLRFTLEGVVGSEKGTATATAFEPLHLQVGLDVRVGGFRLGPYAMYAVARYASAKLDFSDFGEEPRSGSLEGTFHSYACIGLRASVGL